MEVCWGNNVYCIAKVEERFGIGKPFDAVFLFYAFGRAVIGVVKANYLRIADFFPIVEMKFSEVTCTKDSNFEHASILRIRANINHADQGSCRNS
jgi:hypothetical protein